MRDSGTNTGIISVNSYLLHKKERKKSMSFRYLINDDPLVKNTHHK